MLITRYHSQYLYSPSSRTSSPSLDSIRVQKPTPQWSHVLIHHRQPSLWRTVHGLQGPISAGRSQDEFRSLNYTFNTLQRPSVSRKPAIDNQSLKLFIIYRFLAGSAGS
ncbi:hypothetical protein BDV19DRAFT_280610 [Aspergillus venezuelensis]